MTICIIVSTDVMLNLFPWIIIGTLLISGLVYMFTTAKHTSSEMNNLRTGKYPGDIEYTKALEEGFKG